MYCTEKEDLPPPIGSTARVGQDDNDFHVTGNQSPNNPLAVAFWLIIVVIILTFALWPIIPKPPTTSLSPSEIAYFKELSSKITEIDTAIAIEERALVNLRRPNNSPSEAGVRQQYAHLASLTHMKFCRYENVRSYNLAASKISPDISLENEFRRHGLPMGIW
jgi:hypothetical protein